jgi:hypothetical protein
MFPSSPDTRAWTRPPFRNAKSGARHRIFGTRHSTRTDRFAATSRHDTARSLSHARLVNRRQSRSDCGSPRSPGWETGQSPRSRLNTRTCEKSLRRWRPLSAARLHRLPRTSEAGTAVTTASRPRSSGQSPRRAPRRDERPSPGGAVTALEYSCGIIHHRHALRFPPLLVYHDKRYCTCEQPERNDARNSL